jgi:serine/threonine protein kinase
MIGTEVDNYRIEEILGIGSAGVTYKAIELGSGMPMALKMIDLACFHGGGQLERYKKDLEILANAKHRYIARVERFLTLDDYFLIASEYVCGQRLDKHIQKHWPIPWQYALSAIEQILQALEHAHRKLVFHRNIKPGNIIVDEHGFLKLLDFGLENVHPTAKDDPVKLPPGVLNYMPPEQWSLTSGIDYQLVDIYCAGLTIYELLTGQPPFEPSDSKEASQDKILKDEFRRVDDINRKVPKGLADIVMQAIRKEPHTRYQAISEMLAEFDEFRKTTLSEPIPVELSPLPEKVDSKSFSPVLTKPYLIAASIILVMLSLTSLFSQRFNYQRISGYFQPSKILPDVKTEPIDTVSQTVETRLAQARSRNTDRNTDLALDEVPRDTVARIATPPLAKSQSRPSAVETGPITTGTVTFNSTPPGAKIWMDGQDLGLTPRTVEKVKSGKYKVVLRKQNYEEYASLLTLTDEKSISVDVSLQPVTGQLEVLAKPFASIYIDGKLHKQYSDLTHSIELGAGPHWLRLEHPSLGFIEKRVEIEPQQIRKINFDFTRRVKLKVLAFDPLDNIVHAEILIDGQSTGRYTPGELELPVGNHTVAISHTNYLLLEQEINLESDLKLKLVLHQDFDSGKQKRNVFNLVENTDTK